MRILKNKTAEECAVTCGSRTVEIPENDQADLAESFAAWELASSESLLLLLAQGIDKYQLNDGSRDLGAGEAIDLIRGYQGPAKVTDDGVPIIQSQLPEGRRCDFYTPNFCDKTTWYQDSSRETDEELTDSGDHTTYNLDTPCAVVDVKHGKIFGEDNLLENYGTVVKVDDVEKTENSPGITDGDYSINYATGAVTFNEALAGTETVTMSYSKVGTSLCKVKPPTGCKLRVGYVEVQFSKNLGLKDTLIFQMWGLADVFAPGQFPPGTMIPISSAEKYKTMSDFIADAEKSYPLIPVMTGSGDAWRMHTEEILIFRFDYTQRASTDMYASYGMEIRVWLENDVPYEGEYAVGTFYGRKEVES